MSASWVVVVTPVHPFYANGVQGIFRVHAISGSRVISLPHVDAESAARFDAQAFWDSQR